MIDISKIDERGLEDILSEPTQATREVLAKLDGDVIVLGAGSKMGPTLAMMLKKASSEKNVYAVSRFTDKAVKTRIEQAAVKTIEIDLLDGSVYRQPAHPKARPAGRLPNGQNVFYLVGMKFGVTDNQPLTWALNSFVPGLVARHYKDSRIVVFSTGNVYPLVDIESGGATEKIPCEPIGEYTQSCLGRERIFQYFSQLNHTPMTIVRLNYANEPRYGIVVDLNLKILNDEPIDLTMPAVNLIWQRDAIDYIMLFLSKKFYKTSFLCRNPLFEDFIIQKCDACGDKLETYRAVKDKPLLLLLCVQGITDKKILFYGIREFLYRL